jgi:hypothetical protein
LRQGDDLDRLDFSGFCSQGGIGAVTKPAVSDGMILIAYLLAIFFPAIGFFVGLWLMITKKSPIHGAACVGISIFTAVISLILWCLVQSTHNN